MSDDDKSSAGEAIRGLRMSRGLSQENVAQALDISLKTVGRIEKEGRGHNLRRIRTFLEGLSASSDSTAVQSVRTFIDRESVPGGYPLALAFHELAALLERLPIDQRASAVQTFIDVQRRLDDGAFDPLKTLEAAAQVTVKAFAQFLRPPSR